MNSHGRVGRCSFGAQKLAIVRLAKSISPFDLSIPCALAGRFGSARSSIWERISICPRPNGRYWRLGIEDKLADLGLSKPQIAAAVGNIVGRMAAPASELATFEWLRHRTALGELVGYDYEGMELQQLYRSADNLLKHRDALEQHIFGTAKSLFDFNETITLYDPTNTYLEGQAAGIGKAKRGRSKEKRSDCPLVTMGLVLDVSGFPKRSRVFAGNVGEASTLPEMLAELAAPAGATLWRIYSC